MNNNSLLMVPQTASDCLIHSKDSDNTERIILPITRYDNVMHSPDIVLDGDTNYGAPFHLLHVDEEDISESIIRHLCGRIV